MNNSNNGDQNKRAFCASAVVWLIFAIALPLSQLWAIGLTLFAMGVTYFVVKSRAMK